METHILRSRCLNQQFVLRQIDIRYQNLIEVQGLIFPKNLAKSLVKKGAVTKEEIELSVSCEI